MKKFRGFLPGFDFFFRAFVFFFVPSWKTVRQNGDQAEKTLKSLGAWRLAVRLLGRGVKFRRRRPSLDCGAGVPGFWDFGLGLLESAARGAWGVCVVEVVWVGGRV